MANQIAAVDRTVAPAPNALADLSAAVVPNALADLSAAVVPNALAVLIVPVVQIAAAVAPNAAAQVARFYRVASALIRNPNWKAASTVVEQEDYDRRARAVDRLAESDDFHEAAALTVANRDQDSFVRYSYLRLGLTADLHAGEQAAPTDRPACRWRQLLDSDRCRDRWAGPPGVQAELRRRLVWPLVTAQHYLLAGSMTRPDRVR